MISLQITKNSVIKAMKKNEQSQVEVTPTLLVTDEHHIRVEKVKSLRAAGIEPWPGFKPVNATAQDVLNQFVEGLPSKTYEIAGRIVALRLHGKTAFGHMQDRSGKVQFYLRQDDIGDQQFEIFKQYIDVGDIIWLKGESFKTKTGETTLRVHEFTLLSKCLFPLPEKFHGLTDVETIYRQRYLDLISNPDSRQRFAKRSEIIRLMRDYLVEHGFMEVETPMLHPIPGGAAAKPFVTHHNALDQQLYMRIAPELYLKRLVVGGFERLFEINRNFRNEGISTRHNPEFTMIEFYMAHQDYHFMMDFVEDMIRIILKKIHGSLQVSYGSHELDFEKPFARKSIKQAVMQQLNLSEKDMTDESVDALLKKHKLIPAHKKATLNEKIYTLFEDVVESTLIQPTFIIDFPIEVSPLSKRDSEDPSIAARFELFIAGMELSNSFNELNDPFDQAERFHGQAQSRAAGDDEAHYYDADYVHSLEYALPPTVGVGIGIDRLTMVLTNTTSIKDVILFPTLKKKEVHTL